MTAHSQLNIRHQVDPRMTNVETLNVAVEIFKGILKLKIAEHVAVRGPLNSACVLNFGLHSEVIMVRTRA